MYGSYMDQCKNLANCKRDLETRLEEISLEKCKLAEANRIKTEELSKLTTQNKTLIANNLQNTNSHKEDRKKLEDEIETTKMEYSREINKSVEKILLLEENISSIFKCDNCGQVFSDESGLQSHTKLFHTLNKQNRTEDKRVKCKECGKPFFTKDDMQRHIISKHQVTISKEVFLKKQS